MSGTASRLPLLLCAMLVATPAAAETVAPAAPAQEAHAHGHSGAAVRQLELDDGRKWPTDESLRSGMAAIRSEFETHHGAIHEGQETDSQYDALARAIESQVDSIVRNCKLPPRADANLHYVIADLLQGAGLMRGTDSSRSRHDGAALVHGALIAYGKYFADPAWPAD